MGENGCTEVETLGSDFHLVQCFITQDHVVISLEMENND